MLNTLATVKVFRASLPILTHSSVDMQDTYLLGSFKFSHITLKNPLNCVIDFQLKAGNVQLLKPESN